jgi:VanZ family protein
VYDGRLNRRVTTDPDQGLPMTKQITDDGLPQKQRLAWFMLVLTSVALLLPGTAIDAVLSLVEPAMGALRAWKNSWWPWPAQEINDSGLAPDKIMHFFLFAVCGALVTRAWRTTLGITRVLLLLLTFGVVTEVAQFFIPDRSMSPADVVADAAGILAGVFIWSAVSRPIID